MLLVNVHELDVVLAQTIALAAFKHEIHHIRRIFRLQGEDVLILRAAENFHERRQVDTERKIAVAAKWGEGFSFEHHGHEGDMGVIHGL